MLVQQLIRKMQIKRRTSIAQWKDVWWYSQISWMMSLAWTWDILSLVRERPRIGWRMSLAQLNSRLRASTDQLRMSVAQLEDILSLDQQEDVLGSVGGHSYFSQRMYRSVGGFPKLSWRTSLAQIEIVHRLVRGCPWHNWRTS